MQIITNRYILTLPGGIPMAFREIPARPEGVLVGSREGRTNEQPVHRVVFPEPFWLAETPVTQAQFAAWTSTAGVDHSNKFSGDANLPAESMDWDQADAFCEWLADRLAAKFPDGMRTCRLPLECEWEYACRGGQAHSQVDYHGGDGPTALDQCGWFGENSVDKTDPVGQKAANSYGLRDMHGNVWEWCMDRWDGAAYARRWEGITATETWQLAEQYGNAGDLVFRGGCDWLGADGCRASYRFGVDRSFRFWFQGFRPCLVRSPLPSSSQLAEPPVD